ncbi:putative inorganic carbon transporter subunit DabA [Trichinella pseudospiralis]
MLTSCVCMNSWKQAGRRLFLLSRCLLSAHSPSQEPWYGFSRSKCTPPPPSAPSATLHLYLSRRATELPRLRNSEHTACNRTPALGTAETP